MLSSYLEWVGDLAATIAQGIGQSIAVRLNKDTKDTDSWSQTAIKFCVFAVVYPALTVGVLCVCLLLAWLALKAAF